MQRNTSIDLLKGFLITLVCIGHTCQYLIHINQGFWQDPLFKAIYMFHMPLFMAVAGYLSYRGINATQSHIKYIMRRAISFLVPIFVWLIMEQVLRLLLTGHLNAPNVIITSGLQMLWFLWVLIGSIILTSIATATGKYRPFMLIVLFLGTLALPYDILIIYMFKYLFPFFVTGFYFAKFDFRPTPPIKLKFLTFILGLGSFACFLMWDKSTFIYTTKMSLSLDNLPNVLLRWLFGSIVSGFVVLSIYHYSSAIPKKLKKILIMAGRDSIYIYILQAYTFLLIFRIAKRFLHPVSNIFFGDLLAIIIGFLVTCLCLVFGRIISKNKYFNRILFGKG